MLREPSRNVTQNPGMTVRRVPIPQPVYAERHRTVESVRGLAGGIVALALVLLFVGVAVVPFGLVLSAHDGGLGPWFAVAAFGSAGVLGMAWVVRQWRRPVPHTVVSDIGVLGDAAAGWFNDIRWDQLRRHPSGGVDVWVATSSRSEETLQWLHFFTAERPTIQPTERKLRLLVPQTLGCLWYGNAFALRRALLLQLATRAEPPLRFDPMVFVQMGLHPQRWTPMPWPRRVFVLLMLVPVSALFAAFFLQLDALPSVWWGVGILVVGMLAIALIAVVVFSALYPQFSGDPYVFDPPN